MSYRKGVKYRNHATFVDDHIFEIVDRDTGEVVSSVFSIGEPPNMGPRLTVPGQGLSPQEIVSRYVRGSDAEVFTPVYTDNLDIPDNYERMNELDRLDHARQMRDDLQEKYDHVRMRMAEKQQKERERKEKEKEKPIEVVPDVKE